MKKIVSIILFAITLFSNNVFSQSFQLLIAPKPSPYLSDWQTRNETARLLVNNSSGSPIYCKIKTQLYNGSGALVSETDISKMLILTIMPGIQQFNAEDIYPFSALKFYGASQTSIIQTGRIPDDNYQLCTNLMDPTTGVALNGLQAQCAMFSIIAYQAPVLIAPRQSEVIPLTGIRGVIFRWSPVTPTANYIVTYKLQVWEVLDGQDNVTALRNNQPIVDKEIRGATQSQWPIDFAFPEAGNKYVWSITPLDDQERKMVEGIGMAEPKGFEVGVQHLRSSSVSNPPDTNTIDSTNVITSDSAEIGDTVRVGLNGEFTLVVLQITKETDGSLTGKGSVRIPWLKTSIAVDFKKIKIDSAKYLIAGGVTSTKSDTSSTSLTAYPLAWGQSWLAGPWVANKADGLMNWSNNVVNNQIAWVNNNVNSIPYIDYQSNFATPPIPNSNHLKMPFGIQFNNGTDKLVITEFIFKPNESKVNFLVQGEFFKNGITHKLGFAGKYFKIHPNQIDFSAGRVELVEDVKIPNVSSNPKMKFCFKKGTTNSGCYIQWANTGITDISIGMDVKFTRNWFLPVPTAPDSVVATLTGNATNMHDIILTGTMPKCEIVGCNGLKLNQALTVSIDLSDIRNPINMVFPTNYPDTTDGVAWQGIYIKTLSMLMPDDWKSDPNSNAPTIAASDIIIDDMGLTTNVKAYNVLTLQTGQVANLSASIDTIKISIVCNSLVNGKVLGKMVLPLSNQTMQNTLNYTASFALANNGSSFQMIILPTQPISNDIMKGSMTLSPTSNITATKTPNLLTLSILLNGVFKWDHPDLAAPVINLINSPPTRALGIKGVKMEMAFENLSLTYKNYSVPNVDSTNFNIGTWSFASPQKFLANFPITIKHFRFKNLPTVPPADANMKEVFRGQILIDIIANLTEDIGGMTTLGLAFALERNKTTKGFTPKYKGVFVDSIAVHADLSAVKINGALLMYDNDPKFGDGFKATLGVTFTAVSLQINALAQFGSTTYLNNGQFYRYWRVEADVKLPAGIPFLTGVGFYGFGGGAFYNMKANAITSIANPGSTAYTFEPKKGLLGFQVKATVATMPKFETFNTDVELMASFTSSGGITQIGFLGNFWLAAKLTERPASKIKGSVMVDYIFTEKIFNMAAGLLINVPDVIVTPAPIGFTMNINGSTNLWYFKCGIPTAPNQVNVFNIPLYSYLMFGNNIPPPSGFTTRFSNNYFSATGYYPSAGGIAVTNGVNNDSKTAKGFATGVGIEFSKDMHQELYTGVCRNWSIDGNLLAGAELNLSLMQQNGCIGINGYRASGNLGLYASVAATINGNGYRYNCDNKSINLFTIKTGAWIEGKFPNPEYLAGSLYADIDLFDHLCQVTYSKYFEKGTNCNGTAVVTANAAQEDKAGDLKNKLIQYVSPTMRYSFPITSTNNVKYALVPNQVFDLAENQGDGTIKNRTFKLVVTTSLAFQNNGWVNEIIQTKANNMGEFMHYIKPPLNTTIVQGSTQFVATIPATVNTNNGNNFVANNGRINISTITTPLPPPPTPNYPNPLVDPLNNLTANMEYKFIVTATLMEYSMNHIPGPGGRGDGTDVLMWAPAKNRSGVAISETKIVLFRTGPIPIYNANNSNR